MPRCLLVLAVSLGLSLSLPPSEAWAHAILTYPIPRDDISHKLGPCGVGRTQFPTRLIAGQTLEVRWNETFEHPGYYRVSFSAANDAAFRTLIDNVPNPDGLQPGSSIITLPSQPCAACTLQLIQVMVEPTGVSNYYSCADIVLTAPSAPPDAGMVPSTPDAGAPITPEPQAPVPDTLDPVEEPTVPGTGEAPAPARVAEVRGGCDSAAGAGLALAALVLPAMVYRRRQRRALRLKNAPLL